jgi:hypothetical protein
MGRLNTRGSALDQAGMEIALELEAGSKRHDTTTEPDGRGCGEGPQEIRTRQASRIRRWPSFENFAYRFLNVSPGRVPRL